MVHRALEAPRAVVHYAIGTCYVLVQLVLFEHHARALQPLTR